MNETFYMVTECVEHEGGNAIGFFRTSEEATEFARDCVRKYAQGVDLVQTWKCRMDPNPPRLLETFKVW